MWPVIAGLSILFGVPTAAADWTVRARGPADPPGTSQVATAAAGGEVVEIQAAPDGVVQLTFRRSAAASRLAASQCPTFQVDQSLPLLHPPIGAGCTLDARAARVEIARQGQQHVDSKFLYVLVNGTRLAVRYQAVDRQYVETVFSLRRAKRAVKQALGGRRIRPR